MRDWYDYRTGEVRHRDETSEKGGTMRLGAYPCRLIPDTRAYESYQQEEIFERHRHRYEFNLDFKQSLTEKGLDFERTLSGWFSCGDYRITRPPLVFGVSVSPGIQIPSHESPSLIQGIYPEFLEIFSKSLSEQNPIERNTYWEMEGW